MAWLDSRDIAGVALYPDLRLEEAGSNAGTPLFGQPLTRVLLVTFHGNPSSMNYGPWKVAHTVNKIEKF